VSRDFSFWDSSALIPLFVVQPTSPQARILARNFRPVVWWATSVEVQSAIARLHRRGELDERARDFAISRLVFTQAGWREVPPSEAVRHKAEELLQSHTLRAADSLQLAAALIWCGGKPARRSFLCSDVRLSEAATAVGFDVLSP
jgi:predicted nucleic acid-binding protein